MEFLGEPRIVSLTPHTFREYRNIEIEEGDDIRCLRDWSPVEGRVGIVIRAHRTTFVDEKPRGRWHFTDGERSYVLVEADCPVPGPDPRFDIRRLRERDSSSRLPRGDRR